MVLSIAAHLPTDTLMDHRQASDMEVPSVSSPQIEASPLPVVPPLAACRAQESQPEAAPDPLDGIAEATRHQRAVWAVPFLTVSMLTLAATAYFLAAGITADGIEPRISWWALAIGFALAESLVVHLPVRRDSHTISMSEIPLVLGLALADPIAVVVARAIAGAVVLIARRQPALKLSFNLALFTLETTVALLAYRLILGSAAPDSPTGWLAAMVAIALAVVVSAALVDTVIALNDRRRRMPEIVRSFAVGTLMSVAVGFLGTIAVVVIQYEPRAIALLGAAMLFFFVLFRSFGTLSRRHDDLNALYSFTNQMDGTLGSRDIAVVTLREAVSILRAEHGEIILSTPTDSHASYLGFSAGHSPAVTQLPISEVAGLFEVSLGPKANRVYGPSTRDSRLRLALGTNAGCGMISPIRHGDGSIGVLVVTGRTGIAKHFSATEQELLDTIANHASLTLERARVIEQLETEVAIKQELIRSKDQLIAAVSHELRTPLTGVLGFAEMLRDNRDDFTEEDADAMLRSIADEACDLTNLVEDLLTAARAQMGSLTVVSGDVSVRSLISRVVETTTGSAHHIVVSGSDAMVRADDGRVRQILRNLISNAQRYGGHRIHIASQVAGGAAHIRVSDNGDGIPEHDQERIFSPYESAHDPGTQPGSLGLGLAISRALAQMMQGDLTYSRRDGWTTFDLRLPLAPEAEPSTTPQTIELEHV